MQRTELKAVWSDSPEMCHIANSISFLLEVIEPYICDVVEEDYSYNQNLELNDFVREERNHYKVHTNFNDKIRDSYPGHRVIMKLLFLLWALIRKFPHRWQIGILFACEAFALSSANWIDKRYENIFKNANPKVEKMFLWHFKEEYAHCHIAYGLAELHNLKWYHKIMGMYAAWLTVGLTVLSHAVSVSIKTVNPFLLVKIFWNGIIFMIDVLPENGLCLTSLWGKDSHQIPVRFTS